MLFLVPRTLRARILFSAAAALLILPLCAHAQRSGPPVPVTPGIPGVDSTAAPAPDPGLRRMTGEMALKRNTQRQQQIVSDTAHLLQLAQKLNDEVSKSNKDELSVSVVKQAEEIEKLAKTIKERMRDGT